MVRLLLVAALALFGLTPAAAQQSTFDLAGPAITLTVTRNGETLPISQVPGLSVGDRITGSADLPEDKSARYLLVIAFLRGATAPPPKDWFHETKTWKRKKNILTVTVPQGAEQAIALLVPNAGGGVDSVIDTVRDRPGVFVRAAQDLHQASLDRARLEAFVSGITNIEEHAPERLEKQSPILASALAMQLNTECLSRQRGLRAACLTQNRENLILQTAASGTSMGERIIGAPTDVAYRIAATREGGAGFYSPYIALARDLVRLFGAFRSSSYQYLPALTVGYGDALHLRLNAPPSFANPRSVLVTALPPIGAVPHPTWRAGSRDALCLARPGLVLPVENAPLLYATGYARDLFLRMRLTDGRSVEMPLRGDAERGGLIPAAGRFDDVTAPVVDATVHGKWGFDQFAGPDFAVQDAAAGAWRVDTNTPAAAGRAGAVTLRGGAAACVAGLAVNRAGGQATPLEWKAAGRDAVVATLPAEPARAGASTMLVTQFGGSAPVSVAIPTPAAAPRPAASLISRRVERAPAKSGLAIMLPDGAVPPDARLTFSFRSAGGDIRPGDIIEIATPDQAMKAQLPVSSGKVQDIGDGVGVATIDPRETLGAAIAGPIRFRMVRGDVAGDWQPLAQIVRLPTLDRISCPVGEGTCTLEGDRLFLLSAIAGTADFQGAATVPAGYVANRINVARPAGSQLFLRLRDAPDVQAVIDLPERP